MLQDSITLAAGGSLSSLPVPNGATFPVTPGAWPLFRLTATVGQNAPGFYTHDGSNWVAFVAPSVTPVYPHDISVFLPGKPAASEVLLDILVDRAFALETVVGKVGIVGTAAATVFTFTKNGSSIGTVSFPANQLGNPTVTVAATNFGIGDIFKITAPASANAALADVVFYCKGHVIS